MKVPWPSTPTSGSEYSPRSSPTSWSSSANSSGLNHDSSPKTGTNSNIMMMYESNTKAWLEAIERCTQDCRLRGQQDSKHRHRHHHRHHQESDRGLPQDRKTSKPTSTGMSTRVISSLAYLRQLEAAIGTELESTWRFPPKTGPPAFVPEDEDMKACAPFLDAFATTAATTATTRTTNQMEEQNPRSPGPRIGYVVEASNPTAQHPLASNPFASIALSDDEQDDVNDDNDRVSDSEEAGDFPLFHKTKKKTSMSLLRLMIRICTATSDLYAQQGHSLAKTHEWSLGAFSLQCAIQKIQQALLMADSEISRYYQRDFTSKGSKRRLADFQQDADIVHVSIASLVNSKDRFIHMAKRQSKNLKRVLEPQWKSRDEIKQRMGDRWSNNPNPKHNFSRMREEHEIELKEVQEALEAIQESDLMSLAQTAQLMKSRVDSKNSHRYNGKRPEEDSLHQVVRLEGYPDATEYGWHFTGSNAQSRVEFFEMVVEGNALVKLDYYYSTGTVKTSLDHPHRGKTQLFASADQITPDLYIQILKNPRVHTTDLRYSHKEHKPNRPYQTSGGRQRGRQRQQRSY